jgi:hypothetical protein
MITRPQGGASRVRIRISSECLKDKNLCCA